MREDKKRHNVRFGILIQGPKTKAPGFLSVVVFTLGCQVRPRGGGGGGGGVTPIHYLYRYVPPNGVVILKLLIFNGVSISEAFSRTGYNISNAGKLQFCKQPFGIIQGQIAVKNTVQCVNKQTVVILLHPVLGVFWREPRALTPPSWINRRAEVWKESIMYPREMGMSSRQMDGEGEGKS